ncbi:MAG: helix-turn-helix domain-containing protein [Bacteroidetes bacterium]|nr:helix-turn-helix domain-containing protein [Bacteroidota bacterium]
MYFSTNLKILRRRRKLTQDDVSLSLSMKRSTISGYENGIAQPVVEILIAFSNFYKISIDTLIKVDLSTLSESQLLQLENGFDTFISGGELRVLATTIDSDNNENIELVNQKASAGYRAGYSDPEYIKVLPTFQLPFLSKEKKYRTFQIEGDSMLPIPSGSWVTAEFVQNWNFIRDGYAYIILTIEDGIVFKVIESHISEDGTFKLFSLNNLYKPFSINIKDIREIWKFIHYISSELPEPNQPRENIERTVADLKKDVDNLKKSINNGVIKLQFD